MLRMAVLVGTLVVVPLVLPDSVQAQDFERPGLYLAGGWARLGEQFGDELDDELADAFSLDDARLSVGDTDVFSGTIGVRLGSRLALEVVGEQYQDLPIDLSLGGVTLSGDVELRSAMLMGKLYLLTGRIQPYLMAGAGYLRARADFGGVTATGHAALARAGGGIEVYLARNWAVGVQAAYSQALSSDLDDIAFFTVGSSLMLRF